MGSRTHLFLWGEHRAYRGVPVTVLCQTPGETWVSDRLWPEGEGLRGPGPLRTQTWPQCRYRLLLPALARPRHRKTAIGALAELRPSSGPTARPSPPPGCIVGDVVTAPLRRRRCGTVWLRGLSEPGRAWPRSCDLLGSVTRGPKTCAGRRPGLWTLCLNQLESYFKGQKGTSVSFPHRLRKKYKTGLGEMSPVGAAIDCKQCGYAHKPH